MGCTQGLARILVFIANFFFLLVGVALLALGIFYKINYTKVTEAIPSNYGALQHIPILAIVVGAIIFFIAFLGCCGALKSSTCMLTTYGTILFVIFLLQIGLGIYALIEIKDVDNLKEEVIKVIQQLVDKAQSGNSDATKAIGTIQETIKCCGVRSSNDWSVPPASCYDESHTLYSIGCADAVNDFIKNSMNVIAATALAVSVVEVVGAVLALCLSNCIRAENRKNYYS